MNLWVSSGDDVRITDNTVIGPYQYQPVATCCPPYPYPQPAAGSGSGPSFISWATECRELFVKNNCVRNLGTGYAGNIILFNVTGSVQDSEIVNGGFSMCSDEAATFV